MALFENFPYTNLHELNMDWIIQQFKKITESTVLSVNGKTGEVILYENPTVDFPAIDGNSWQIVRNAGGTICGIHFNNDGTAVIMSGNRLISIYTSENPPPYPVTSVNGMTGNITLFTESAVRLPNLTDEELHNWNIFRSLNGVIEGIEFTDEGKLIIIHGNNRYQVYSANNQPNYPVTSVEGLTGDVVLFPDADIQFNDITDETQHFIRYSSFLNNKMLGIEIDDDGKAYIWNDENKVQLYMPGIYEPSDFIDPTSPVLEIVNNLTTATQWGIVRLLANSDKVGFVVAYDPSTSDYKAYMKINSQMVQLLTLADIPSQSGVISINGDTGVVTLTGEDVAMTSLDSTTIASAFSLLKNSMCIVEDSDTATHNIIKDEFVLWHDRMYQASTNIAVDDTLSSSNLTIISKGALNNLEDIVDLSNLVSWGASSVTGGSPVCAFESVGRLRMLRVVFHPTTSTNSGWKTVLTVPSGHRPASYVNELTGNVDDSPYVKVMRLTTSGELQIYNPGSYSYSVNMTYIAQ